MQRATLVLICGLIALAAATRPAAAGPWLRPQAEGFASAQSTQRSTGAAEIGLYVEYGLREDLTLGAEFNHAHWSGHALAFARLPILRGEWVAAGDLGTGMHRNLSNWAPMLRGSLSLGHGGSRGWASITAGAEWRAGQPGPAFKLDVTAGSKLFDKLNPILFVETHLSPHGKLSWTATPGLTWTPASGGGRTWLFGIETKGGAQRSLGLRMGLWTRF